MMNRSVACGSVCKPFANDGNVLNLENRKSDDNNFAYEWWIYL